MSRKLHIHCFSHDESFNDEVYKNHGEYRNDEYFKSFWFRNSRGNTHYIMENENVIKIGDIKTIENFYNNSPRE